MTDSEFLKLSESTLRGIESALEVALTSSEADIECTLAGNILEIEFIEKGSVIIVNSQSSMQEIWVAAPSGGSHFRRDKDAWIDTRTGVELYAALSTAVSAAAGIDLVLAI